MKPEDELRLIEVMAKLGFEKDFVMDALFYLSISHCIGSAFSEALNAKVERLNKDLDELKQQKAAASE